MGLGITRKQLVMVAVLLSGTVLTVLNMTLLTPALPTIMRDTGVGSTTVQWLTSGYSLVNAVVIPLSAYLMGRFSTRKLYIGGMGIFAVGSLVAALAPNFWFILVGRVLQAICTGAVMPMVASVILMVFPREKRGTAMGIIGLIIGFAPTLGPTISGVIVDAVGWRALFWVVFALSLVVIAISLFTLDNSGEFERTRFDAASVVLSTVGLVALLYGLSSFSSSGNITLTLGLVIVGVVLVALYARRQNALEEPMLKLDILKNHKYLTATIVIALFQAALIGMETIMPLYIQDVLGHDATTSGLTLLPGALLGAITGLFAGRIFDRHGVRLPVVVGAIIIAAAALGFAFLLGIDTWIVIVSAIYALMALGIQFTMTPLNTWGVNALPNEDIRYAQSTSNTINQVAGSFGTALLVSISTLGVTLAPNGSLVEQTYAGYHLSFSSAAAIAIIAVVLILTLVRERKSDAEKTPQPKSESHELHAGDIMNPNAATAPATATVGEVMELMAKTDTTGVSIVDDKGALVGYVTDGDIARYVGRQDATFSNPSANLYALMRDDHDFRKRLLDLAGLGVMKLATTKVVTVDEDTPADEAAHILSSRKIKKVPVVHDGKLVGALSRRNLMHALLQGIKQENVSA